jgi:hypothetical protein
VDAEGDLETGAEMSPKNARLAAELIPGSQLVELSGGAMLPRRHWYARSGSCVVPHALPSAGDLGDQLRLKPDGASMECPIPLSPQ